MIKERYAAHIIYHLVLKSEPEKTLSNFMGEGYSWSESRYFQEIVRILCII